MRVNIFVVVFSLGAVLCGCADPPPMILVRGASPLDDQCVASAAPSSFLASGRLDISANSSGYVLFPNVENVSPASNSTGPQGRSASSGQGASATFGDSSGETNRVMLNTASVSYNVLTDGVPASVTDLLSATDLPVSGQVLEPDGGRASVQVAVLNSQQVSALKQAVGAGQSVLIEVSVVLKGVTSGDRDIESNTFVFPLEICNTCLVNPSCVAEDGEITCNPGQDKTICTGTAAP